MATVTNAAVLGNQVLLAAGQTQSQTVNLTGLHALGNNFCAQHLIVMINIATYTAGDLAVTISGVSASAYTWTILSVSSLASAATTVLQVGPGLTNASNATEAAILPSEIQIAAALTSTPNMVYGIDYYLGQ